MDLDIIQARIGDIGDEQLRSMFSLIYSDLKQIRNETRENSKRMRDRINNLSSILIKRTNREDLEKVMAEIT